MKSTREMIKVMQAYVDGELCQVYNNGAWQDMDYGVVCLFDWADHDYRIKPKETETERKIKVMLAYTEGKPIEVIDRNHKTENPEWTPCMTEPDWNWSDYDFRVKKG